MKKIVWLFMSAMALSLAISCNKDAVDNSSIIEFKDPIILRELVDKGVDTNGDGRISQKEANEITYLSFLENKGIRAFDEISYFLNIEEVVLYGNQLTSIDISKNTKLKRIYLHDNQLTSIDVSKNAKLELLSISDNQLTSIDVSKNAKLESLSISDNQLTSIDVSKNAKLESLSISDNQLTSIDVSKNIALMALHCSDNKLTTLDVSRNTDLKALDCTNNNLTVLDLSKNKLLGTYMVQIDGNPLQKIIISYYSLFPEKLKEKYKDIIEYVYD